MIDSRLGRSVVGDAGISLCSCIRLDELGPDRSQLPTELERCDHLDAVAPSRETLGELACRGTADVHLNSAT